MGNVCSAGKGSDYLLSLGYRPLSQRCIGFVNTGVSHNYYLIHLGSPYYDTGTLGLRGSMVELRDGCTNIEIKRYSLIRNIQLEH